MQETEFIYGRPHLESADSKVLVKMYVPKRLKTGLDSLKIASGRNLQELAAEAIEEYLQRQIDDRRSRTQRIAA